MERKVKQHYVFKKYLSKWLDNNHIHCLRDKTNYFTPNLVNVAQEREFYRVGELNELEMSVLLGIICCHDSDVMIESNLAILKYFTNDRVRKKETIVKSGVEDKSAKEDILDCNYEEDYHCKIEGFGIEMLEHLYKDDLSVFNSGASLQKSLLYLTTQYFRTKRFQDKVIFGIESDKLGLSKSVFAVLRAVISNNVASYLYFNKANLSAVLLKNHGNVGFVCGDQPVINLSDSESDDLKLFYPISPDSAVLVYLDSGNVRRDIEVIQDCEVVGYNKIMLSKSHKMIFASKKSDLDMIR